MIYFLVDAITAWTTNSMYWTLVYTTGSYSLWHLGMWQYVSESKKVTGNICYVFLITWPVGLVTLGLVAFCCSIGVYHRELISSSGGLWCYWLAKYRASLAWEGQASGWFPDDMLTPRNLTQSTPNAPCCRHSKISPVYGVFQPVSMVLCCFCGISDGFEENHILFGVRVY